MAGPKTMSTAGPGVYKSLRTLPKVEDSGTARVQGLQLSPVRTGTLNQSKTSQLDHEEQ